MTQTLPGPTALAARALAPDLARGVMLLCIALANSHYFLQGSSILGGYPQAGSPIDAGAIWFLATFVDGRAFPMFGLLFGYGVAHIVRRQGSASPPVVRRLLWRRSGILIAIGTVHGLLLYVGDILSAYGVLLLAGAWMVRWKDRSLLIVGALAFVAVSLPTEGSISVSADPPDLAMLPSDPITMIIERLQVIPFVAIGGPIGFLCPFAIGLWAGRRRVLDRPERHRALLWSVATVGIAAAVLGAQPVSLVLAGALPVPAAETLALIGPLHDAAGVLGGLGYAAAIALLSQRWADRRGPVVEAIVAVGQRSMTCYLTQSVVWSVAFTPFLLDLSATLTVTTTALLAVATWGATIVLADRMRRAGRRGPFEVLVRRVTYGRAAS